MTLETESLRRELWKLEQRLDIAEAVLSAHKTSIDRLDDQCSALPDAQKIDAAPVASALEALVAGLRAENERLKAEMRVTDRLRDTAVASLTAAEQQTAEAIAGWLETQCRDARATMLAIATDIRRGDWRRK